MTKKPPWISKPASRKRARWHQCPKALLNLNVPYDRFKTNFFLDLLWKKRTKQQHCWPKSITHWECPARAQKLQPGSGADWQNQLLLCNESGRLCQQNQHTLEWKGLGDYQRPTDRHKWKMPRTTHRLKWGTVREWIWFSQTEGKLESYANVQDTYQRPQESLQPRPLPHLFGAASNQLYSWLPQTWIPGN